MTESTETLSFRQGTRRNLFEKQISPIIEMTIQLIIGISYLIVSPDHQYQLSYKILDDQNLKTLIF